MRISSPAVLSGLLLPARYAYHGVTGGENRSIPLSWDEVPEGAGSCALSMIDTHPIARSWVRAIPRPSRC